MGFSGDDQGWVMTVTMQITLTVVDDDGGGQQADRQQENKSSDTRLFLT